MFTRRYGSRIQKYYPRFYSVEPTATTTPEPEVPPEPVIPAAGPSENPDFHKGVIWFENTFPFKWPLFDPRSLWIKSYASRFVTENKFTTFLPSKWPEGAEFQFVDASPNLKEGGLYLEFKYKGGTVDEAVEAIQNHLKKHRVISYFNLARIYSFQVKGRPWIEDLVSRVPSSRLHVEFLGPDLTVEQVYREFRPFGKIVDITLAPTSLKDLPRFAAVQFTKKRSATSALHLLEIVFTERHSTVQRLLLVMKRQLVVVAGNI